MKDEIGNMLWRKGDLIFLQLHSESFRRNIGTIFNDAVVMKRDSSKHLHRKSKSYGFNYQFLSTATQVNKVNLKIDDTSYSIPISVILEEGEFLFFKQQGFERQIFLKQTIINNYAKHRKV